MGKTFLVAVVAWIVGAILGFLLSYATVKILRKKNRELRKQLAGRASEKLGTMDKILVFEAVVLIAYTVADMVVFWHVGAEPTTLTACVFGVCGLENGVMGWIKTNKDKTNGPSGDGSRPAPGRNRRTLAHNRRIYQ